MNVLYSKRSGIRFTKNKNLNLSLFLTQSYEMTLNYTQDIIHKLYRTFMVFHFFIMKSLAWIFFKKSPLFPTEENIHLTEDTFLT